VSLGEGQFQIVGCYVEIDRMIPEHTCRESKVRVQEALARQGVRLVGTVDVRLPCGAGMAELDLAIALACLEAIGLVGLPEGLYCRAELGLDGTLRPVLGCFAALTAAKRMSMVVVSRHDRLEAEASGKHFIAHECLADVASAFSPRKAAPYEVKPSERQNPHKGSEASNLVQIAALEGRSILLLGRPGSGHVLMARYYHSFLSLSRQEAIEVMQVQSAGGVLDTDRFKVPFRAPHHSVSEAGMIGGGDRPRPGEVSLAHNGVLMLDDLPDFRGAVLTSVRQVFERKYTVATREGVQARFPANFRIVASASPCPRACRDVCNCPGPSLERYRERLALVGELEVIRLP